MSLIGEINQPLTAVIANAGACARLLAPPQPGRTAVSTQDLAEIRAALADIVQDGQRAGNLARIMRLHLAQAVPDRQPVDVNALVQHVLTLAEPALIAGAVDLRTDLQPDLPVTHGHALRLRTAIYHLVRAAITGAAAARPPVLTLQTRRLDGRRIAVSLVHGGPDAGAAALARELDIVATAEHDPIHLGLWASTSIIQDHDGSVAVAQVAGTTTIQVILPTGAASG